MLIRGRLSRAGCHSSDGYCKSRTGSNFRLLVGNNVFGNRSKSNNNTNSCFWLRLSRDVSRKYRPPTLYTAPLYRGERRTRCDTTQTRAPGCTLHSDCTALISEFVVFWRTHFCIWHFFLLFDSINTNTSKPVNI